MLTWKKIGKTVNEEGTTIIYEASGTVYTIESRKRHIPHAGGGSGTWDHTTYHILKNGVEVGKQYSLSDAKFLAEYSLSDAKYLAETMIEEETE